MVLRLINHVLSLVLLIKPRHLTNGIVERKNQTLMNAMLINITLSKNF